MTTPKVDPTWVVIPADGGAWHIPRRALDGFKGLKHYPTMCGGVLGHVSAYGTMQDGYGHMVPGCPDCLLASEAPTCAWPKKRCNNSVALGRDMCSSHLGNLARWAER